MGVLKRGLEKDPESEQMRQAFFSARYMAMNVGDNPNKTTTQKADEVEKMEPIWTCNVEECVSASAFSPDGKVLAVGSLEGPIHLFDAETGKELMKLKGHNFGTQALAWNPRNHKLLASSGQDGRARVWDTETGKEITNVKGGAQWVEHLLWVPNPSADNNNNSNSNSNSNEFGHIVTASAKHLKLWNASTGDLVRTFVTNGSTISDLVWNEAKQQFAISSYSNLHTFDVNHDEPQHEYTWKGSMISLVWSKDTNWLIAGCQENCIHLWDTRTDQDLMMQGYRKKVKELSMDSSSRWLATGGGPECMVWDFSGEGPAGTMPKTLEAHHDAITHVAFQNNTTILATAAKDGRVFLWDIEGDIPEKALARGIAPDVEKGSEEDISAEKVCWSPDDKLLAAGFSNGLVMVFKPTIKQQQQQ
eukprot:GEZU01000452.1.p1 GENE.GEZU01000452.1~~GEZU01000452.1.p1  ORF type:complete len:418 (-),score=155.48 GEZU01000452.1:110-1363(-)